MNTIGTILVLLLLASSLIADSGQKYWIFFTNKGPVALKQSAIEAARSGLSEESIRRRSKQHGPIVDYTDVPVYRLYLEELEERGIKPVVISRWLNGVSAVLSSDQIENLRGLLFIKKIQPVLRGRRKPLPEPSARLEKAGAPCGGFYDYGASYTQNELCNIPAVHEMGISGQGVIIAVFDTGFRLNHEAFQLLDVDDRWDFINNDPNVDFEEGQDLSSQISHGTKVLSILAGFAPGRLVGPAFGAQYLLAKTENMASETPIEEDFWIAAAEWADARGANVISSSLGYLDWYNYEDMDGDTAPITQAADLAVKKGIVVVAAAGNEGDDPWKYIIAPADGDSVIAVGAVNSNREIAGFSSIGPTSDGRIKPEVVAMGVSVRTVGIPSAEETGRDYLNISGTSAATPLVAGVAALVLSAFRTTTPMQVREALIKTASRAHSPDNRYGYGLVNALAAIKSLGEPEPLPSTHRLISAYPNPFSRKGHWSIRFAYDLAEPAEVELQLYNILGQKVATISQGYRLPGKGQWVSWNGTNDVGELLPSGIYFAQVQLGRQLFYSKFTMIK